MELIHIVSAIIVILFGFFLCIIGYTIYRKEEIKGEIAYNKYLIDKRKLRKASMTKDDSSDDDDDDLDEFLESLPTWLTAAAQGANVDLSKIYYGDEAELNKLKAILDKHTKPSEEGSAGGGLLG